MQTSPLRAEQSSRWRRSVTVSLPLVMSVLLGSAVLALPGTGAVFSDTAEDSGNAWGADTLDPPTAVAASGVGTITVDWTATVDTYATGHRVY